MSGKSNNHIVVIGGSFGGIGVAQNILASIPNVKVTLINTSKDWYFNIAAARVLGKPNSTPLEKVLVYPFTSLPHILTDTR
jgi:NADH dehydrogenase FAD-containing subunit